MCPQRLRRGVAEGCRHGAEIGHPRIECRVLDGSPQRAIELIERRLWSPARRPHAVPNDHLESLHALLVQSRQLWQRWNTRLRGHTVDLDRAALNLLRGGARLIAHEIDLAPHEVVHSWPVPFIRDGRELRPDRIHEQQPAQMRGRSRARMAIGELVFVYLCVIDEFLQVVWGQRLFGDECHRNVGHAADRLEIIDRVVRQVLVQEWRGGDADVGQEHGVAIGLRPGRPGDTERDGTANIFDDDLLLESGTHRAAEIAGEGIARPASCKRHNDRYWSGWIVFRLRGQSRETDEYKGSTNSNRKHAIAPGMNNSACMRIDRLTARHFLMPSSLRHGGA